MLLGFLAPDAALHGGGAGRSSVLATWDCTGSPCPWGGHATSHAAVWPAAAGPVRARFGYSLSEDVYATAPRVAGWEVSVTAGNATVYAVSATGSHRSLAALQAGQKMTVPATLGGDQVVSLQSGTQFGYALTPAAALNREPAVASSSVLATWACTGTPCPWGKQSRGEVAVWPPATEPRRTRYGYTLSHDVYAKAPSVAGWTLTITAGQATVYAGTPNGSQVLLARLGAGQGFTVPASLGADEVVSVQSVTPFDYMLSPSTRPPSPPPMVDCTDPVRCDPVSWVASRWRYNGPRENPGDWVGGVIAWPSWSAYSSNGRTGSDSRTVYSKSGEQIYPYMGAWADGCRVRVVSGDVLIIEWERGRGEWRETHVSVGETYAIRLGGSENSAMIETPNSSEPFVVALWNCTPQRIDKEGAAAHGLQAGEVSGAY